MWGISPGSFHLLRVTVCVHGEGEDAVVDAGLVPRPHLGPGEPARRWLAGGDITGVTTLQSTSQGTFHKTLIIS